MSRLQEVDAQRSAVKTIVNLTSVFEGLASMRISQTKNQVLQSQQFFNELWEMYTQIRFDNLFRFGRSAGEEVIDRQLFILVTAEGGFSGDIDQKLIKFMLQDYDPAKNDIIVIGHHGALQLIQADIKFKKYFTLPSRDTNINVQPLIQEVRRYRSTVVYYQTYVSLMFQDIKKIELNAAVQERGKRVNSKDTSIAEGDYIFEPSELAVMVHLERSMMQIALSQVILDSKLAQYASRFRAMSMANDKSDEWERDLTTLYNRTKRRIQDERLKEIINGLRTTRAQ